MSSSVQAVLASIRQNDSVTVILLTAITYDYVLTISKEIEYIWNKPWTSVSTSYVLVRYCGLYFVIIYGLVGSTFLPGPAKTYVFVLLDDSKWLIMAQISCFILAVLGNWTQVISLAAADLVMILRVWVVYRRSRLVFGTLLALYIVDTIIHVAVCAIYSTPMGISAGTLQMHDTTLCTLNFIPLALNKTLDIFSPILGALKCVLMIVQFTRESVEMYRVTGRWQPNRYMNLFLREGIVYFLVILLYNLCSGLVSWNIIPASGWQGLVPVLIQYLTVITLIPRFIISIRVLYARDLQGRRGSDIDTGFGLTALSQPGRTADMSEIMFTESRQSGVLEEDGEKETGVRGGTSSGEV